MIYNGPKEHESFYPLYSFVLDGQGLERLNIFAPKINNHLLVKLLTVHHSASKDTSVV